MKVLDNFNSPSIVMDNGNYPTEQNNNIGCMITSKANMNIFGEKNSESGIGLILEIFF